MVHYETVVILSHVLSKTAISSVMNLMSISFRHMYLRRDPKISKKMTLFNDDFAKLQTNCSDTFSSLFFHFLL